MRFDVLEVLDVAAPDAALVGRDAADIVGVLLPRDRRSGCQVRCRISIGVFLIHAKDDGLGEAVGLLEEVVRWRAIASVRARSATTRSKSLVWYSSSGIARP